MKDVEKTAKIYLNKLWLKNHKEWSKVEDDLFILGLAKYSIDKDGVFTRLDPLIDDHCDDTLVIEESHIGIEKYLDNLKKEDNG